MVFKQQIKAKKVSPGSVYNLSGKKKKEILFIHVWEEKGYLNNTLLRGVKISRLWISSRKFTRRINKPTWRAGIRHSSLSQEHLDHRLVSQIPVQKAKINAEETS